MQREAAAEVERVCACVCVSACVCASVCECVCACKCVCVHACTCMCVWVCERNCSNFFGDRCSIPAKRYTCQRCCLVITFPLSLLICPKLNPTSSTRHQEKRSSSEGGGDGNQQYIWVNLKNLWDESLICMWSDIILCKFVLIFSFHTAPIMRSPFTMYSSFTLL